MRIYFMFIRHLYGFLFDPFTSHSYYYYFVLVLVAYISVWIMSCNNIQLHVTHNQGRYCLGSTPHPQRVYLK